jgi:hypothetical protein
VVHLKDFSLVSPEIQSGDVLKAIEMAIPAFVIEQAIANQYCSVKVCNCQCSGQNHENSSLSASDKSQFLVIRTVLDR